MNQQDKNAYLKKVAISGDWVGEKNKLIAKIKKLKEKKPKDWQEDIKSLMQLIRVLEDPFRGTVSGGSEQRGRGARKSGGCPAYDDMEEDSDP